MNIQTQLPPPITAANTIPQHRTLKDRELADLFYMVGFEHDPGALSEIVHHRRAFSFGTKEHIPLPDFLCSLLTARESEEGSRTSQLWERAHELMVFKLGVLSHPSGSHGGVGNDTAANGRRSRKRIDCANYYAALWRLLQDDPVFTEARGTLEREKEAARQFQLFVTRNRYWSYIEARREARLMFVRRYVWRLNGRGKIEVLMPKYLKGVDCRKWLERNVPDPDPTAPGEKERIQAIINGRLEIPQFVPLNPVALPAQGTVQPKIDPDMGEKSSPSFIDLLAREKALAADLQRPSIRELGPKRIEELVHAIGDNLKTREFTDEALAIRFGISKTAFSHFGGSDWSKIKKGKKETTEDDEEVKQEEKTFVPDLFRNAAALLSESEIFREMAAEAGVFRPAKSIANDGTPPRLRRNDHDR